MEIKIILSEIYYKGNKLTKFEDEFGQEFVKIGNNMEVLYASFADAKRVLNGEQPEVQISK